MWISIEVRLIIFLYRYQGWVCVRKAGEGAEQRLKNIISFSSLSCQRCQPSLSPLSHRKVDFLPQWQRWKQIVGWGQKSVDEGRIRQQYGFTAGPRSCSTSSSSALGDTCPLSFFQLSLSAPLLLQVYLCCTESTGSTAPIYVTKRVEISGAVAGPFKMQIESF